ncbi:MAG: CpaE family protein [Vicinamibacterales bacterium]
MQPTVILLGSIERDLAAALRDRGFTVTENDLAIAVASHVAGTKGPDVFVVDTRALPSLPRDVANLRRHFPQSGIVILAKTLDPNAMLDAMRMGVSEWVPEPLSLDDVETAIRRMVRPVLGTVAGRAFAVMGGKGGVGCTTVAVNLATALRQATGEPTLFVDLHTAHGDASVFLGVEPRFSVLDALENIHRLDQTYMKGLVTGTKAGLDLLAAATRPQLGPIDALRVRALVEFVTTTYPWVVIDCPRTDGTLIEALDSVSAVLVVANQELATLRSASRLAATVRQRAGAQRVRIAINRFDAESEIGRKDVERVMGGPVAYTFPSDYRASVAALNRGEPLIMQNHTRLATAFEDVARDLAGLGPVNRDQGRSGGFFSRLGGRR